VLGEREIGSARRSLRADQDEFRKRQRTCPGAYRTSWSGSTGPDVQHPSSSAALCSMAATRESCCFSKERKVDVRCSRSTNDAPDLFCFLRFRAGPASGSRSSSSCRPSNDDDVDRSSSLSSSSWSSPPPAADERSTKLRWKCPRRIRPRRYSRSEGVRKLSMT
jgi:hypothetical protein